jgi:hypothetical protein
MSVTDKNCQLLASGPTPDNPPPDLQGNRDENRGQTPLFYPKRSNPSLHHTLTMRTRAGSGL